jgi:hypothetical protein
MTRFVLLFALSALAVPALAGTDDDGLTWGEDDLLSDEDDDKGAKKGELPTRSGPKSLGDEPEEEFDLLSDDTEPVEPAFLGDFNDDEAVDLGLGFEPDEAPRKRASAPSTTGPKAITLDVAGKQPLADNYALTVVAVERDAVVIELPVLVSTSRVGLDAPFVLVGEVYSSEGKVATTSTIIRPESLAEFGPSFVFLKMFAPVMEKEGEVTIKVKKTKLDGSGAADLFSRATPYTLP